MSKPVFGNFWQNCRITGNFDRRVFSSSDSESTLSIWSDKVFKVLKVRKSWSFTKFYQNILVVRLVNPERYREPTVLIGQLSTLEVFDSYNRAHKVIESLVQYLKSNSSSPYTWPLFPYNSVPVHNSSESPHNYLPFVCAVARFG